MKVKKVAVIMAAKDGAVQMSNGKIGWPANLHSHRTKPAKCRMETMRRT
jgi:hypothetical protein